MRPTTFSASIKDRKLSSRVLAHMVREARDGDTFWITVHENKPTRSVRQNSLYWLYLGLVATDSGHTPDVLHEFFKGELLGFDTETVTFANGASREVRTPKSTTRLSKSGFSDYMERIAEMTGIPIPDTSEFGL